MYSVMTVEQFEAQLGDLGENLMDMQTILTEIAGRIVDDIKNDAPVNSGDLKRSIQARITDSELQIEMLNYGLFQNYGVKGTQDNIANEVPEFGIEPQPRESPFYSFKTRRFGIRPQPFFDIEDMSEVITEYVANRLLENNI